MKYLGIDYGAKHVGVAVSDDEGRIAFPRAAIPNNRNLLPYIVELIKKEKIWTIIIGDTRSHGGGDNPVTKEVDAFIEMLKKTTNLPVEKVWEAGSSIEASRYAPEGKGHSDAAAAAVILQRFLDMHAGDVP